MGVGICQYTLNSVQESPLTFHTRIQKPHPWGGILIQILTNPPLQPLGWVYTMIGALQLVGFSDPNKILQFNSCMDTSFNNENIKRDSPPPPPPPPPSAFTPEK